MASLDFKNRVNKLVIYGDRANWAVFKANKLTFFANIQRQELVASIKPPSMSAFAGTSSEIRGTVVVYPKFSISASTISGAILDGRFTVPKIQMNGSTQRGVSVLGNATLTRLIGMRGTADTTVLNGLVATINLIKANFGLYGSAFSTTQNVAENNTIVLNLRTKAHSVFKEDTMEAYATTGELIFGTYKNKNISDAFVFGRSADELLLTTWNDEVTSRQYTISYESGEQQNLKNKKLKLAKGLVGTNWKIRIDNTNQAFTEVRGIDLFVNELKRHV